MAFCPDPAGWGPISPRYYNFTPCFADSFFPIVINLFVITLGSYQIYIYSKKAPLFVRKEWHFYAKFAGLGLLCLFNFFLLFNQWKIDSELKDSAFAAFADLRIYALLANFAGLAVAGRLHYVEHSKSGIADSVLLLYWFFSVVFNLIRLYGMAQRHTYSLYTNYFVVSVFVFVTTLYVFCSMSSFFQASSSFWK